MLKEHLINLPVLCHPNFTALVVVYTVASGIGLGAILVQKADLGTEEVLTFASHDLNPAESNYVANMLECLAAVWALEEWSTYLDGHLCTVLTDHSSHHCPLLSPYRRSALHTCVLP